jgi:hypothetical protein
MTYAWRDGMKNISLSYPKLEGATRTACIAACTYADGLADGEIPRFDGGTFVRPMNTAATKLTAACMKDVKTDTAVESATVLLACVTILKIFWAAGRGDAGWNAVVAALTPPPAKPKAPAP